MGDAKRRIAGAWAILAAAGCGGGHSSSGSSTPPPTPVALDLSPVAAGLVHPVGLEVAGDGSGRLFVIEQAGTIRIIAAGALLAAPFLDLTGKVNMADESGLIGLAFHPAYSQDRRFFVHYDRLAAGQRQSVIAEYLTSAGDANAADPATERILLTVDQPPFDFHKGGQMAFGNDGFLYIGLGDGGGENDSSGNGQNRNTPLAKILRIDVDAKDPGKEYAIPADNPFAGGGGAPETFAFGLRNPWRFSFDRPTGRLFCGDVGQDRFEEIDIIEKGGNYGWSILEASRCFDPPDGCDRTGLTLPIAEYDHSEGEAVIGGFVYRGAAIPSMTGQYIFADYVAGKIWTLVEDPPGTWTRTQVLATGRSISSLGQDEAGEIHVVDYGGAILEIVPK